MVKYTAAKLKLAYAIQRTIDSLETKIHKLNLKVTKIMGDEAAASPLIKVGRRKMSASARAKIAAAQRLRWAKSKGQSVDAKPAKGKRTMSAGARAKIAAAAKARWAKAKAAGKTSL
jgi:hypothetical protein